HCCRASADADKNTGQDANRSSPITKDNGNRKVVRRCASLALYSGRTNACRNSPGLSPLHSGPRRNVIRPPLRRARRLTFDLRLSTFDRLRCLAACEILGNLPRVLVPVLIKADQKIALAAAQLFIECADHVAANALRLAVNANIIGPP